jgi:hypothetical protein
MFGYATIINKDRLTLFMPKKSVLKYLAWSTTPPKIGSGGVYEI